MIVLLFLGIVPLMPERLSKHWVLILAAIALVLLTGSLLSVGALFVIDEFVYLIAAHAMAQNGSLIIDNGYELLGLETLRASFLIPGPNGLTSLYPPGTTYIGGLAYWLAGARGLIVANVLAGVLTLFLIRDLAFQMFKDNWVALLAPLMFLFGTFWTDYLYGFESHAFSILFVTAAIVCLFRSLETQQLSQNTAFFWALCAGLAIGFGLTIRADTVLAIPAIGLLLILHTASPVRIAIAGTLGMLPGVIAAMLLNEFKFGTLNPLSYGVSGGGVDILNYGNFAAILIVCALAAISTRVFATRIPALVILGTFVLAAVFVPELRSIAERYLHGAYALVVDSQSLRLRPDMSVDEHGILRIQGLPKKALGQSVPWLGCLILIGMTRGRDDRRRAYQVIALLALLWSAPLFLRSWDGGFSSNMRYFLPILPLASILAARVWLDVQIMSGRRVLPLIAGVGLGAAFWSIWSHIDPAGNTGAQFDVGKLLFGGCVLAAVVAAGTGRAEKLRASIASAVIAAAFAISFFHSVSDLAASQHRRAQIDDINRALAAKISDPSITIGYPPLFAFQVERKNGFVGHFRYEELQKAIEKGYAIWVARIFVDDVLEANPTLREYSEPIEVGNLAFVRLTDSSN